MPEQYRKSKDDLKIAAIFFFMGLLIFVTLYNNMNIERNYDEIASIKGLLQNISHIQQVQYTDYTGQPQSYK